MNNNKLAIYKKQHKNICNLPSLKRFRTKINIVEIWNWRNISQCIKCLSRSHCAIVIRLKFFNIWKIVHGWIENAAFIIATTVYTTRNSNLWIVFEWTFDGHHNTHLKCIFIKNQKSVTWVRNENTYHNKNNGNIWLRFLSSPSS